MRKRKNYPGEVRVLGTKDYGLILGSLMSYRNQLLRENDPFKLAFIIKKMAEKLQELDYKHASELTLSKLGMKELNGTYSITDKRKEDVVNIANRYWRMGKKKHEAAKLKIKNSELKQQSKLSSKKSTKKKTEVLEA
ncbi:hypothetical protein [Flammeovirga pacifica]|uniref:Uncharacterized protein n=1 Tax=Flammeovirga pacifica TaxID=915059 RepID=A0A1S1YXC1_FLAPC|nr:hypothetical protein [Flammeovirga pacifica]OHX65650.1 hypothetical protein NH26_04445 [Flammeovirga pacifica]